MLGICWGYVGYLGPMLGICEAIYAEKIFRDNFFRSFPSRKAKTLKKPTVFNLAKMKFSAARGSPVLVPRVGGRGRARI